MITVNYKTVSTKFHIEKCLKNLQEYKVLSFDTETRGLYTEEEKKEAIKFLKENNEPSGVKKIALQVANNSGLSFPSLIKVTHFVFGVSENKSFIIICEDPKLEIRIWEWVSNYKGKLLVHNSTYDLKIMYNRVKKFPNNFDDTAMMAKCLINNVDIWKAKVGLKELMGSKYDPSWLLMNDYTPKNLKDPKFIKYAAIDGAATYKLWLEVYFHLYGFHYNDSPF